LLFISVIETQLQRLQKDGDATKQTFYKTCCDNGPGSHPLKIELPEIRSPSLLDLVQGRPDVEGTIRQLRRLRLKERGKSVYIPPRAKASLQSRDESGFRLMEKVSEFLESDQMVFLLLGDSGAGKSTFNRELECVLWQTYKRGGTIPLHINLPTIEKPEHDLIAKQLRKAEFTEQQIRELKAHRKFALICDGYDESQQTHNLYTSNRLNQAGEWNAKMVISCRSEYLGIDYRDRFQPGDRNHHLDSRLFKEAIITRFSMDQIQDYITQYVSVNRPLWEAKEYKKALDLIPSLKELVRNPFLMSLSLEVLPRMVDPRQDLSTTRITRTALYDQFIEHWFERGKKRLREKNLSPQAGSAFEGLIDEGFTRNSITYLKRLCAAIYKEQGGQPVVTYSRYKDDNSWKAEFFSREEEKQILREACPLIRNGNQHRFIHRSLLEYGVALAIFDPQDWKEIQVSESTLTRRRSVNSVMSFDEYGIVSQESITVGQEPDLNSPLAWRRFVNESSMIQFLEERVRQEPIFKQQLFDYIEHSKKDKNWRIAAANAITILVRAGVQFNHADLRGIRIPNADLSYGMFQSAQLQGADLRQVNLRGAWLRRANLDNTQMTGVLFGELPFLKHDSEVEMCAYSPDGETIAAGLSNGKVIMYSTSNWETLWTSEGHSGKVTSMMYSPNGIQIASGSSDHTVQLCDVRTGRCIYALNGHEGEVTSIAYSPQRDQIATSSDDKTVKVWDVESGECRHIWIGHFRRVSGVIYSPNGTQIASRCVYTVRIWDVETGNCLFFKVLGVFVDPIQSFAYSPQGDQLASVSSGRSTDLSIWDMATWKCRYYGGHGSSINFIVYSPNGNQLASAGYGGVRLWDVNREVCLHVLKGHTGDVRCVVYSPQGDLVASAGDDRTVRVWDAASGICQQTLTGHSDRVTSIMFSPKEYRVASSSLDTTVRLWDIVAGTSQHTSSGHNTSVKGVKCSPRGDNVATYSDDDRTALLWDVETGVCHHVLRGHIYAVSSVEYSPQGDQIASGSNDTTVRLWNIESGACTHILKGHTDWIFTIAYSRQGDQLASGSNDTTVRLWDVKSGECRHTLVGHTEAVLDIVYSQNGNQLFSCGLDCTVRMWDVETGTCKYTLGHSSCVRCIAYSPQNDTIVSAGDSNTARVWDVGTGKYRYTFLGHNVVAYSPRGDQIVSGGRDGSVKVWDTESGDCLWIFIGHRDRVKKVVYSTQGDLVVSTSKDSSMRLWNITSGQCRAVIQDVPAKVSSIAWTEASGVNYLVTGFNNGAVGAWKVQIDEDLCDVSLSWMRTKGVLNMMDATIHDAQGLSPLNRQLLKQRGAVGDPIDRLREASKVTTMASVVSKLKASSNNTAAEDPTLRPSGSLEQLKQLEQLLEQGNDPPFQDIVATIVRIIQRYK